ncbi:bifunctional adenosylcobinamide kinase/adenosylcobinamide-phosphate guanylyltransferase [Aquisalimonas sp. APHAB1-3]|uniref:bifunctional adenosylcobinamide kinase/adenosylcobinamide-phosphate guanylyltransferase n=1 Tax=Aquisalimonas sp. APHAB1-3 TaxID=3402080 RepID=UPI003AAD68D5
MQHCLVTGGIRSGKSALAERLVAASAGPVCYIATARSGDGEMAERIHRHQQRRPSTWALVEEPRALGTALDNLAADDAPTLLVDCMSLWLGQMLGEDDETAWPSERDAFLASLARYPGRAVIVSNEVGLGIIGMDPLTRRFADELGWLNQSLAERCDTVVMAVAGLPHVLKGEI